jgi:peptide/nickel transport system substrate-binding protein
MRKPRPIAVVAISVLLAACTGGGNDSSASDESGSPVVVAPAFDHDRPGPARPVEGAVEGGTVTMLTSGLFEKTAFGPDGADPSMSYNWASFMSAYVTRSLTQYVYDPAQGAMVVVPDIATDIGRPNADFTEWTYTIRDGVRFEDGTEVTAADVAFGIERSFDREAFPAGPPYSSEFFLDGDSYDGPYRSGTDYDGLVVDGNTLTIKMERPFPDMPYWGTFPAMGPVPEYGSHPDEYWRHPLATGPYMFGDYAPGESLTLVRNPEWDPDTDPGRHAYPNRLVAKFGVPTAEIERTILGDSPAGRTTFTTDVTLPDRAVWDEALSAGRLTEGTGACTFMWALDTRKISDVRLRRAIGYAYPYRAAATAVGQGRTFEPSQTLLPPGFPGRRDIHTLDTDPGRTDADAARALVQEATRDGVAADQLVLSWPYVNDDPGQVARMRLVAAALERVGFTAEPRGVSGSSFPAINDDPNAPFNIRWNSWCADWMSGSNWLPPLLRSDGAVNFAHLSAPDVDQAIDAVSRLPVDQQPAAWGALDEDIMTDYYPLVVFGGQRIGMLHGADIAGIHIYPANQPSPTFKDISVAK